MKIPETLLSGILLFCGTLLSFRYSKELLGSGFIPRTWRKIVTFHEAATGKLIERGIFRSPGIGLVSPVRSWMAGEAVFLAVFLFSSSRAASLFGIFVSLASGLFLGIAVLVCSLREEAKKRINEIRSGLPLASFLLSLVLEAGMGSSAALREVAGSLPRGALFVELDRISRSGLLGMSRENAIDRSAMRVPLDEYRLFLNLMRQGERLGVGFSKSFRELSSGMMDTQWHRAESLAQKASVKLLFPLVFFIFPSVFLIVLSPVILSLINLSGR